MDQQKGQDRPDNSDADQAVSGHKSSAAQASEYSRMDHGPCFRDVDNRNKQHDLAAQFQIVPGKMIELQERRTQQEIEQGRRPASPHGRPSGYLCELLQIFTLVRT